MNHIDEHTLEFFVLGDPFVKRKEDEIRTHLQQCVGCKTLYDEILAYYDDVKREYSKLSASPPVSEKSIIPGKREIEPYFESIGHSVVGREVRMPTVWRRVGKFGVEHPVISSTFAAMLLAVFVLSLRFLSGSQENPAYYYYNTKANDLEVYGNSDKLLWSLPAYDIEAAKLAEDRMNIRETLITDLKNDRINEIITTVPFRSGIYPNPVKVYDGKGKLLNSFAFKDKSVFFRSQHYDTPFQPDVLLADRVLDGGSNLFIYSTNGRSPSFLARLDGNLDLLGRYWHYGNFTPYLIGMYHDGFQEVAIAGVDDMDDMAAGKFEFLAILDPTKIVGDEESPETPGFGFAVSDAELYYIKLPKSDIEIAQGVGGNSRILRESDDSLLHVNVDGQGSTNHAGFWGFDFIFSMKDLKVMEVKFTSVTLETYATLKTEGKVHGTFDKEYLEDLKNGVEYWNGQEWVKEATEIGRDRRRTENENPGDVQY